jgi:cation:H+ antiporter
VRYLSGPLLLAAGLVLVIGGAEVFFAGLLSTASRLRVAPFVLVVVVSGFELENLVTGIAANESGYGNVAAGTFLGGTTFIALAVAGLSALAAPIEADLPRAALAWTALAPIPLVAAGLDGFLSRIDGVLLVTWFGVCLTGLAFAGRELTAGQIPPRRRWPLPRMLGGIAVLTGGGYVLGEGIGRVLNNVGISQSVLGNIAIAASVEAEEVARVAVPARRGRGDIALGGLFGTIVHFAALNAGIICLVKPISLDGATQDLHLPMAAASSLLLVACVATRRGISRVAGGTLLAVYAAYVAAAIALGT